MGKSIPTASQLELLMSDWLANLREQGSFVHKNNARTIKRRKTNNYSDYFTAGMNMNDMLDVLRNARDIAQGTVASMTQVPVRVVLGSDGSYTNGETVVVATDYFDDPKLSVGDKIDILTGFSIHEAAHINHTDMEDLEKFITSFPAAERKVAKAIHNIIEDERIEYLTGEDRPGLMDFIATVKEYCWKKFEKSKNVNAQITETLPRFINTFLYAVRFPSILTEEMVSENFDELSQIRKVLMPFPLSNEGAKLATKKIMDIMKNMIKDELQDQQNQQEQQQAGNDPSQGAGAGSNQDGQPDPNQSQPKSNSKPKAPTAKEVKDAMGKALQSNQMKDVLNAIKDAVPEPGKKKQSDAACLKTNRDGARKYVNGEAEKICASAGPGDLRYMIKARPNQSAYQVSYNHVKQYIPAIRKALTCQTQTREYELRGEPSGKLNTNKLTSLKSGNRNIFTKHGEVSCDKASVCLLIDESGSMSTRRLDAARETAILIKEAVKDVESLDLFIYGFGGSNMHVYQEGRKCERYSLGSLSSEGGTPTGEAMQVAFKRMSRNSYPASLMLVITDGDPDSREAVKEADEKLRKIGVIPIGIGIDGCKAVETIFKEYVVYSNLSELAPQLGRITKKRLMKMLERHDSMM